MGFFAAIKNLMKPVKLSSFTVREDSYEDRNFYRTSNGQFKFTNMSTEKIRVVLFDETQKVCLCPYHMNWEPYSIVEKQLVPKCGKDCGKFLKVKHKRMDFPPATMAVWDPYRSEYMKKPSVGEHKVKADTEALHTIYDQIDPADDVVFINLTKNINTDNYTVAIKVLDRVAMNNKSYFKFLDVPMQKLFFNFNCKTGKVSDVYGGELSSYFHNVQHVLPKKIYDFIAHQIKEDLRSRYGKNLSLQYGGNSANELSAIVQFPYEPNITDVVQKKNLVVGRDDPEVFNHVCQQLGVKSHKMLRKNFAENPVVLITEMEIRKLGFSDVNYINSFIETKNDDFIEMLIGGGNRWAGYMCDFYKYLIEKKGEGPAMHILLKNSEEFNQHEDIMILRDAARIWSVTRNRIEQENTELQKLILREGLSSKVHENLYKYYEETRNGKMEFTYRKVDKTFEGDFLGYEFRLPKDTVELSHIGWKLHNCVSSYADRIVSGECLVVYGTKGGEIRLCIEVRNHKVVHQMRVKNNQTPEGMDLMAVEEWRNAHNLEFHGNSY